jgi:cation diffusion facilitator family transporter
MHSHSESTASISDSSYRIKWVTWLGAIVNVVLAALKLIAGWVTGSTVLIADAAHSFSDLISDGVTLWAVLIGRKPKDENHPYGHGRFETIGTLFVAILLGFTAIGIGWHAFEALGETITPDSLAITAAIVSILLKEGMYQVTNWVALTEKSKVLQANAWHHRTDALSSVAALIGVGGSYIGFSYLDPLAALVVTGLILKTAWELGVQSVEELTDTSTDPEAETKISQLMPDIAGVEAFHEVRVRRMGSYLLADLHVEVDGILTVSAAHQIAERVRLRLLNSIPSLSEVLVHIDPEPDPPAELRDHEQQLMRPQREIEEDIRNLLLQFKAIRSVTHCYCHFLHQNLTVHVHVEMEDTLKISEARKIAEEAESVLEAIEDVYEADIHLELSPH